MKQLRSYPNSMQAAKPDGRGAFCVTWLRNAFSKQNEFKTARSSEQHWRTKHQQPTLSLTPNLYWHLLLRVVLLLTLVALAGLGLSPLAVHADTPTFNEKQPFGAGSDYTESIAVGDLNGDDAFDIVVGNGSEEDMIYWNDGSGGFLTATSFGAGIDRTGSVTVGDLNGDGALDIVEGNSDGQHKVYWNDGDGGFPAFTSFGTGSDSTNSIVVGDLNGDGALDIVSGNYYEQHKVYWNDGSGSFPTATSFGTGTDSTMSVAVGDLNGDGALDIVVGNMVEQHKVYWNDGNGNFTATTPFGTGLDWTEGVVVGDLNGDGAPDIVLGNYYKHHKVYWNDGDGGFPAFTSFGTGSDNSSSIAVGDLNGDGALDIVVGNAFNNAEGNADEQDKVYWNDSSGGFSTVSKFGVSPDSTSSIAVGDLNGDGALDIAIGNDSQQNKIYWNDGGGDFSIITSFDTGSGSTSSIAVGDLNGDGALDVVEGNYEAQHKIYWNNGNGSFPTTISFGAGLDETNDIAVGDLNGDGALDVVEGNYEAQHKIYWNNGNGNFTATTSFGTGLDWTGRIILGDLNGDGSLDILANNLDQQDTIYWNDGSGGFFAANPFGADTDTEIAVGDLNGDGDLDIVEGNYDGQHKVYWNDGAGGFSTVTSFVTDSDRSSSLAMGDLNGDGALDVVVGNIYQQHKVYWNDGGGNFPTATPFGTDPGSTSIVAIGDLNGDGALDIIVGSYYDSHRKIYWNNGSGSFPTATFLSATTNSTACVVAGDLDSDGALDIVVGNADGQHQIYWNRLRSSTGLVNTPPYSVITRPVSTGDADFYSSPQVLESIYISIPYTLFDLEGDQVGRIAVYYSLNGGGQWLPAIAAAGTVTTNLAASPAGVEHIFVWDTFASGLFGRFDNVVIRIEAYPQPPFTGVIGSYHYANSVPGPFLWPYTAATTFPFSVRGTQVRVYKEIVIGGNEVADALVYRLPGSHSSEGSPIITPAGETLRTDGQGYLRGHGALYPGDRLMALAPIVATATYTLYHTSATPTLFGLDTYTITAPGAQTLTVSAANPLLLFELTVSLEWDAGSDEVFLTQLQENLHKASRALYDWTNGQVALGQITVYQNKERWDEADVQVLASNQIRPHAYRGGIVTQTVSLDLGEPITVTPGAIRIGPTWNRYGEADTIGEDWPRVLAHELGHYALYLEDTYLGLENDLLIPVESCLGTAMTDPYNDTHSEFRYEDGIWEAQCGATLAALPDWAIITKMYPALHQPPPGNLGPVAMPFAFTTVQIHPTTQAPSAPVLDDANVQLDDVRLSQGRVYLIRPGEQMVDLGRPVGNTVLARGARQGDELCVFAETAFACTMLTNGAATRLSGREAWQPQIWLYSLNATTLQLWVNDPDGGALNATVYANGQLPMFVTITSGVTATISLSQPALDVLVDLRGDEEGERLATGYAIGSGPGRTYSYGGPFTSGDGSISLIPPRNQPNDAFMVLQTATGLPGLPPGHQPIGRAYTVRSSANLNEYEGGSITFQYLGRDVLLSGLPEKNLAIYYHPSRGPWQRLHTVLNQTQNFASSPMPGPGLYMLMASYMTTLSPGWNNVSYQLQEALPVTSALASIAGYYTTIYGYYPTDTDDSWKVYDIDMPNWATDLEVLEPGKGYWIRATESITWYLSRDSVVSPAAFEAFPVPPATYYGVVLPTSSFTPTVGMTVIARVNGQICGQSETQTVDGEIVYVIDVVAEGSTEANACGSLGQLINFEVGSAVMASPVPWNNDRPQAWSLRADMQQNPVANWLQEHLIYLPVIQKGGIE